MTQTPEIDNLAINMHEGKIDAVVVGLQQVLAQDKDRGRELWEQAVLHTIKKRETTQAQILLTKGAEWFSDNDNWCRLGPAQDSPFLVALRDGSFVLAQWIHAQGWADVKERDRYLARGCLDHVLQVRKSDYPQKDMLKWLIENGADAKGDMRPSNLVWRPLMHAVFRQSNEACVSLLMEHGASLDDQWGEQKNSYRPKMTVGSWAKEECGTDIGHWAEVEVAVKLKKTLNQATSKSLSTAEPKVKRSKQM